MLSFIKLALSEELGDEELFEMVQKFIHLLVNAVYKYEGMVDKLTGDGLMALFGAPIACVSSHMLN